MDGAAGNGATIDRGTPATPPVNNAAPCTSTEACAYAAQAQTAEGQTAPSACCSQLRPQTEALGTSRTTPLLRWHRPPPVARTARQQRRPRAYSGDQRERVG